MTKWTLWTLTSAAALLTACGGGSDPGGSTSTDLSGARGSLMFNPPLRVTALSAGEFKDRLAASPSGQSLLAVAGAPKCGVNVHYIEYGTVGGASEATNASGALMVPSGTDPQCSGARPVVLYAHGTTTDKAYNIADITEASRPGASEGSLLAAMYAAQGFIVVAPNYAGYDVSKLGYHPYLNADQQSKEMIDALTAARKALPNIGGQDAGKLLITGYSQGGHVAMATHRALQAAGLPVTASAPMSGPYALGAFGDAVYYGNVNLGATVFTPLLATSYQKAYGNIYSQPSDIYEAAYATGIETLLPSLTPVATLFSQGKLPQTALFSSTPPAPIFAGITPPTTPPELAPLFALGFGTNNLINNASRLSYLQDAIVNPDGAVPSLTTGGQAATPAHPMRKAFKANDLRNWAPLRPVMLCGGKADPTVFYDLNTKLMQGLWSAPSPLALPAGLLTVLDVDSPAGGAADPFAAAKAGFAQAKANVAGQGGANAVVQAYHGTLVPPFCNAAARAFFQQVLASGG
ncbi:alpha/beta hydrolase [Acidovorax sp. SRB_14]|uniref:alpha/beta hydrolase family protein n=1 Tax=Acidovorax sp. SRB_14 TaxID=1962699 RepID=UPI001564F41B|nr:alpha/beta hydrolase [Acidovorax sp. SRB_14]NMM82510.1 alpha/beta hydrolase [Acidovorax sp. SRB_14]